MREEEHVKDGQPQHHGPVRKHHVTEVKVERVRLQGALVNDSFESRDGVTQDDDCLDSPVHARHAGLRRVVLGRRHCLWGLFCKPALQRDCKYIGSCQDTPCELQNRHCLQPVSIYENDNGMTT
jgi:hypothetical protein